MQLSLELRDDAACPPGTASELAGDRSASAKKGAVAGFSSRKDAYNTYRRCKARLVRAEKSHHGQRLARRALNNAMAAWLRAGMR